MAPTIYAVLASAAVAGLLGGWGGYRMGTAGCADELAEHASAQAEAWKSALERERATAEAERKRAVVAAQARARSAAMAEGVKNAAVQDLDRNCEWRPAHRLRIESIYAGYGYPVPPAEGMRAAMPDPAVTDAAARAVGAGDGGLGNGLRSAAP